MFLPDAAPAKKELRHLFTKIHINKGLKAFFLFLTAGTLVSMIMSLLSLFITIPFIYHKHFYIITGFILAGLMAGLMSFPRKREVLVTGDALGLEERLITAFYQKNDPSPVAALQREDTQNCLQNMQPSKRYRINLARLYYIPAILLITLSIVFSVLPSNVHEKALQREILLTEIKNQQNAIEEQLNTIIKDNPDISEQQLNKLKDELNKLEEALEKLKTGDDALKALAQMQNAMNELKKTTPSKDLDALASVMEQFPLTSDLAKALEKENNSDIESALDELIKGLEGSEDNQKLLEQIMELASLNMPENSMLAAELQKLSSTAASSGQNEQNMVQSLSELLNSTIENASGEQNLQKIASSLEKEIINARRSISDITQTSTSGKAGEQMQAMSSDSSSSDQNSPDGQQNQPSSGSNQGAGQQQTSGQSGTNGQAKSGGSGAGEGTSSEDAGYTEGDLPGDGRSPGQRKESRYEMIYMPERLGGDGNETSLSGQKLESGSSTYSEADGAPVMKGEMVPWKEVLAQYREEAVQSMDRQEIPPGMKSLIRDYFSSLE